MFLIRSDSYARHAGPKSSPYKAMLLNKVVVGKGYKVTSNEPSLRAPPPGYDSVSFEFGLDSIHVS